MGGYYSAETAYSLLLQKWQQNRLNNILDIHAAVQHSLHKHKKKAITASHTMMPGVGPLCHVHSEIYCSTYLYSHMYIILQMMNILSHALKQYCRSCRWAYLTSQALSHHIPYMFNVSQEKTKKNKARWILAN